MSEEKLLSIIVPIYNEENTVKEILTSLTKLKEKVQSIEIIVVNDGSTDNSLKILNENHDLYDCLIKNSLDISLETAIKSGLNFSKSTDKLYFVSLK